MGEVGTRCHDGAAVRPPMVRLAGGTERAVVALVNEGGVRFQGDQVAGVHPLAGVGGGSVVREGRVATITEDVPCPGERGRLRAGGRDRRHHKLRFSHGRVVAGVVPMSAVVGQLQVIVDVHLKVVELPYGFIQGLLCVTEAAASPPCCCWWRHD